MIITALYEWLGIILIPFIKIYLFIRLKRGKEERMHERYGIASQPRPEGVVVWFHAASVGEALSISALYDHLHSMNLTILITSTTVASAHIIKNRFPKAIHQYVPLDLKPWVHRFLNYWKPSVALFVESELWPTLIKQSHKRSIPLILINGDLSKRSFKRWKKARSFFKRLMSKFDVIFAQSKQSYAYFKELGINNVRFEGHLKLCSSDLPYDVHEFNRLKAFFNDRPLWLAASTHPGEEKIIINIHEQLIKTIPNLVTIIAPRHSTRRDEIQKINPSFPIKLRSWEDKTNPFSMNDNESIYLVDTMGELGLFYRLCRIVFMGGTLTPIGGHNIIEPAQLGCCVIWGPYSKSIDDLKEIVMPYGFEIQNSNMLHEVLLDLINNPHKTIEVGKAVQAKIMTQKQKIMDPLINAIQDKINLYIQ
jgi:3-deoxy-D-manno-octulosonic-acid transferase